MCKAPPSYIRGNDCNAIRQMSEYVKDQFIYHLVIYDVPFGRAGRRARIFMLLSPCYTLVATLEHIQKDGT